VEEIEKTYEEESVLICSHSSVNLMILCEILGLEINHFRHLRHSAGGLNIKDKDSRFLLLWYASMMPVISWGLVYLHRIL